MNSSVAIESLAGRFSSQGSIHSQQVYRELLEAVIGEDTCWLDLGCGHSVFPDWMRDRIDAQRDLISRCAWAVGCDPGDNRPHDGGMAKVPYQGDKLPFADESFSLVTANMVVEHVEDPESFCKEVYRVLRPCGLFILHTPNLSHIQTRAASLLPNSVVQAIAHRVDQRDYDDIFPTHYKMNTRKALEDLPGFYPEAILCVGNHPQFQRVPVLGTLESLLVRALQSNRLREYRADWIAIERKV